MRITYLNTPIVMATVFASALTLSAQEPPRPHRPMDAGQRAQLEQKLRWKTEQALRERLKLTDDQVKKLRTLDARFQPRRGDVMEELRTVYAETEKEVARGDAADQKRVGELMQRTSTLRKRFMDVVDEEQRELLTFLTPVQASQYISFQKQLRDKVREKAADSREPARDRGPEGRRRPEGDRRIMPPGNPF